MINIFKKNENNIDHINSQVILDREAQTISFEEKKYYQPDDYYRIKVGEGTPFEREIIPFEKRKKTAIPSENGLYVPEILMLYFCSKYPEPQNGYPGYWWYSYGVRNVGKIYQSLVDRGFLSINDITNKYELTEKGKTELENNAYIPYMHKNIKYINFTPWDLNLILTKENKANYVNIIEKTHQEINKANEEEHEKFMEGLKATNPQQYDAFNLQDKQLESMKEAEEKYKQNKDLEAIIVFWEAIWEEGGPKFEGSKWLFYLPDLYIKAKRYDEAISLCKKIKQTRKPQYREKASKYIEKIEQMINK